MAKQTSTQKVATKKHMARLEREQRQNRIILAVGVGSILIVAALLVFGYFKSNVVANVNGVKITTSQWQERVRLQRVSLLNQLNQYQYFQQYFGMDTSQQQQQVNSTLSNTEQMGQDVLDAMVDDELIRQEAKKLGITVSSDEVEQAIQEAYSFFPNGTPTPTVTPTEFALPTLNSEQLTLYPHTPTPTELVPTSTPDVTATPDLSTPTPKATTAPPTPTAVPPLPTASATPYTLEGFKTQYDDTLTNFTKYNISEKTLRSVYENQLLRKKLQDHLTKDTPHTAEQVLARHILVADEQIAIALYQKLLDGEDFATLAKENSMDTGSGANGGNLGWAPASNYVPEFAEAVTTQPIGEIGKPVKTEYGFHIIQVIAREELPLTDAQYEQQKQKIFDDWLTKTREAAKITTYDVWKDRVPTEPAAISQ
jgi:parvulin-like peptidyl-prolyl isomerase